jgi:hypothetical protein
MIAFLSFSGNPHSSLELFISISIWFSFVHKNTQGSTNSSKSSSSKQPQQQQQQHFQQPPHQKFQQQLHQQQLPQQPQPPQPQPQRDRFPSFDSMASGGSVQYVAGPSAARQPPTAATGTLRPQMLPYHERRKLLQRRQQQQQQQKQKQNPRMFPSQPPQPAPGAAGVVDPRAGGGDPRSRMMMMQQHPHPPPPQFAGAGQPPNPMDPMAAAAFANLYGMPPPPMGFGFPPPPPGYHPGQPPPGYTGPPPPQGYAGPPPPPHGYTGPPPPPHGYPGPPPPPHGYPGPPPSGYPSPPPPRGYPSPQQQQQHAMPPYGPQLGAYPPPFPIPPHIPLDAQQQHLHHQQQQRKFPNHPSQTQQPQQPSSQPPQQPPSQQQPQQPQQQQQIQQQTRLSPYRTLAKQDRPPKGKATVANAQKSPWPFLSGGKATIAGPLSMSSSGTGTETSEATAPPPPPPPPPPPAFLQDNHNRGDSMGSMSSLEQRSQKGDDDHDHHHHHQDGKREHSRKSSSGGFLDLLRQQWSPTLKEQKTEPQVTVDVSEFHRKNQQFLQLHRRQESGGSGSATPVHRRYAIENIHSYILYIYIYIYMCVGCCLPELTPFPLTQLTHSLTHSSPDVIHVNGTVTSVLPHKIDLRPVEERTNDCHRSAMTIGKTTKIIAIALATQKYLRIKRHLQVKKLPRLVAIRAGTFASVLFVWIVS